MRLEILFTFVFLSISTFAFSQEDIEKFLGIWNEQSGSAMKISQVDGRIKVSIKESFSDPDMPDRVENFFVTLNGNTLTGSENLHKENVSGKPRGYFFSSAFESPTFPNGFIHPYWEVIVKAVIVKYEYGDLKVSYHCYAVWYSQDWIQVGYDNSSYGTTRTFTNW